MSVQKSRVLWAGILVLCPVGVFASTINLGSIATSNIAVLGYDSGFPTSSTVLVTKDGTSHINVSGDVVSNSVGSGLTFSTGSAVTSGSELTNAQAAFTSVVTQLNGLVYTAATITAGTTNTFSTPGNYILSTGVLNSGHTIINITAPGQYNFKVAGNITWSNVTINALSSSLSSDDIFWYDSGGAVSITGSAVFGDVVQAGASNDIIQDASGLSGSLTGRFLSGGFDTSLTAVQGSTETINNHGFGTAVAPEPSTFVFLSLGLVLGLPALRRRSRQTLR
jgi:hypothetical protein